MAKGRDLKKVLQALGIAGQTISRIEQIKIDQAEAEAEATEKLRKITAERTKTREANLLKLHPETGMTSVPFPGGGGGGMDFRPTFDKPVPTSSELLKERKAQGELGVLPLLPSQKKTKADDPLWKILVKSSLAKAEGTATAFDLELLRQNAPSLTEAEKVKVDGVPFRTIRQIITDSFPTERDMIGQVTGRRANLPEDVNTALMQGDPMPMYRYVAKIWKEDQELAKALGK